VPSYGRRLFALQLRHLRRRYRLLRAAELQRAAAARRPSERFPVAVTFDDDLVTHLEAAAVLRRHRATATFFLCGASLERPFSFWWEDLQQAFDSRRLRPDDVPYAPDALVEHALARTPSAIHRLAAVIEKLPADARADVAARLCSRRRHDVRSLSAADVRALAADFEIGFHTLRHHALMPLDDAALARALEDGRSALAEVAGASVTTVAYPFGDADVRVAHAARAAGYAIGFTTRGRAVVPTADSLLLGRLEPSHQSVAELGLQIVRALFAARRDARRPPLPVT